MSGPKVINIEPVRLRQKRESRVHLHKLQIALAECERWQSQPQAAALFAHLNTLREAEQWEPLSIESGRMSSFYEEEAQRLRQRHATEQAASLRRAHRLQQSITQMTVQLQSLPPSTERDKWMSQLASADSDRQEAALNAALQFIEKINQDESATSLRELAAGLIDISMPAATPATPQAHADPHQQRLERCWAVLGELSALENSPDIQAFSDKARGITMTFPNQQALLLDSLALEISTHLQTRRAAHALRLELEILLTELDGIHSPDAAEWKLHLTEVLAQPLAIKPARQITKDARTWMEQTIAEENRQEQRSAVLRALAATGYEIREGMATAWVEEGRLVLRKPNESSYGVELSAPAQGSAVQTRVVALGNSPRDPQRDLEVEETWCDEFEKARTVLNEAGFKASLIQAHPAGSVPLKMIAAASGKRQSLGVAQNLAKKAEN